MICLIKIKYVTVPGLQVSPAIMICELYTGWHLTLTPHLLGSHGSNWISSFLMSKFCTYLAYLTAWPLITFDLINIWSFPWCIHDLSSFQVDFQLFKWVMQIYIFRLSYKLTSDDLQPWYVTLDLMNIWKFSCCIYVPSLVEIHEHMWKIWPNVNIFL